MKKCNTGDNSAAAAQITGEKKALAAEEQREKKSRFDELIKGEFKDVYDEYIQSILRERLGKLSRIAEKYEYLRPALEALAESCGADTEDSETLAELIMRKISAQDSNAQRQHRIDKITSRYENWLCQSGEAHALYPEFDLTKELENEEFKALLRSCIPVKTAYEFVHREEFLENARREMEKELQKKAFAGALRPMEGALGAHGGTRLGTDVSNMSRKTREEIIKRVQRGEKISF